MDHCYLNELSCIHSKLMFRGSPFSISTFPSLNLRTKIKSSVNLATTSVLGMNRTVEALR